MKIYDKIKQMSKLELTNFLKLIFDDKQGSIAPIGIGCSGCIDYQTHHYPDDCIEDECKWVNIGCDYEKWLDSDWKLIEEELEE